jgi:hypothetical protein
MDYTPAPWFIKTEDTLPIPPLWTIRDQHRGVIATIESVNPDDAALIVAAPDLLTALRALCNLCEDDDQYPQHTEIARAAINKATRS